jgi:hypothetical protein
MSGKCAQRPEHAAAPAHPCSEIDGVAITDDVPRSGVPADAIPSEWLRRNVANPRHELGQPTVVRVHIEAAPRPAEYLVPKTRTLPTPARPA